MKKQALIDAILNTPTFVATFRVTKNVYMKADKGQIVQAFAGVGTYRYYDTVYGVTRTVDLPASVIEFDGYKSI